MEKATYVVGDEVEVTIFGRKRQGKVTDVALMGSYELVWLYQIDGDGWYRDTNLKPVERKLATPKFKVGDEVLVKVADWGLGSGETNFVGTIENVRPRSNDALYTVNGEKYAEHWLRPAPVVEFMFNVGDTVAHVSNLEKPYVIRERFVLDRKPRYKFEGYNSAVGYPEHVYVPFEVTPKFKVGDKVRLTNRANQTPRSIVEVVKRDGRTLYFLTDLSWPRIEDELVLHKTEDRPAFSLVAGHEVFSDNKVRKVVGRETIFAVKVKYEDGSEELIPEKEKVQRII